MLLSGLFTLLGVQQGVALWRAGDADLGFDLATGAALAGLAAALLGLLAVVAIGRTLRELDRAETLHWDSMEGVRGLTELASRRSVAIEDKLPQLLEMGCERLGLEIGLVSRVRGERYEVVAIHAPDDFPVGPGAVFCLDETYCRNTLESDRPVAIARAADAHWADHPARTAFRFDAYLASSIRVGDAPFGTLVFGSPQPRDDRFTATHKDLVLLMAQWIGSELERRELARGRPAASAPARSAPAPSLAEAPAAPGLDLNALLDRLEKRIRRAAGARVEVAIERGAQLALAREPRIPLATAILSLVRRIARAMPEGGRLTLATANHEPPAGEPGVLPAVVPARYVTLALSESSGAVEPDQLTRVFDALEHPEVAEVTAALPQAEGGLPLSAIYRMLQRAEGDLSVEIEPGRGSRFTLFLPLAAEPERPAPRSEPSLSPAIAASGH